MLKKKNYDFFISYRRDSRPEIARIIKLVLEQQGKKCFLDVDCIDGGYFDTPLFEIIKSCRIFILILTESDLVSFRDDNDWLKEEIYLALREQKTIIPLTVGKFDHPASDVYPEEISKLSEFTLISYSPFRINYLSEYIMKEFDKAEGTSENMMNKIKNKKDISITRLVKFIISAYFFTKNILHFLGILTAIIISIGLASNTTQNASLAYGVVVGIFSLIGFGSLFLILTLPITIPFKYFVKLIIRKLSKKNIMEIRDFINQKEMPKEDKNELMKMLPKDR